MKFLIYSKNSPKFYYLIFYNRIAKIYYVYLLFTKIPLLLKIFIKLNFIKSGFSALKIFLEVSILTSWLIIS
ncbi:unnamed protein product [Blepharisma stoltei]|uniref:Uncharacterized protein n=1 Tax=Blepharisma stoltei TaxID=1481888 RepID=A0AAU9JNU1_9CILI|nr:unnamed protein product [Blepharisma stoltei]